MRLAINLATRNRPALAVATVSQTLKMIQNPWMVKFMVSVDEDDKDSQRALALFGTQITLSVRPREDALAAKWNRVCSIPADVYMTMCDDAPVVTKGFDRMILDAAALFPDGIGVVYNHLENASFVGIQAVTRRWVELTGGIYPEYFPYWFCDHWLDDIARMTGRIAFADVRLDSDSNRPPTMELREPSWWATFFDMGYMERRRTAHRVIDACDQSAWLSAMLRSQYPLVEYRSRWINNLVRTNIALNEAAGSNAPDERYLRMKAHAKVQLRRWVDELDSQEGHLPAPTVEAL